MGVVTQADLNDCEREPIHIPGSIQPHGMMLVAHRKGLRVHQVAGAIETRLGAAQWQHQDLSMMIGEALREKVALLVQSGRHGGFMGQIETTAGEKFDVSAYLSALDVVVELEPASPTILPGSFLLDELAVAAGGFERSASLEALWESAAIEFRLLTGFDRVMVYRFLEDNVGCVVAEDKRDDMQSFLHHHFPASDIPRQARALYVRNLIRVIPDVSYAPVLLRGSHAMSTVDLSDSSLRSVSPIHLEYLRNMGVKASASMSIVKDGVLWGLIACHHETPRSLSYDVRSACRSLAGSLARHIKSKEEAEGYRQRIRLRSFEDDIVALLSREGSIDKVLSGHMAEIARMMNADGLAIVREDEIVRFGTTPNDDAVREIAAWHLVEGADAVFSTDSLSEIYQPAANFKHLGSGLLAITITRDDPWLLLWFRVEQIETLNWAGNPHKSDIPGDKGMLTPRASFEAWRETVSGRATRWNIAEIDAAARLRSALLDVRQHKQLRELNRQLTTTLQDKERLLQQKEFLIGEVNHRVQNSLQLVSSYLSMQARSSKEAGLQEALGEARRRLSAVALVHRRLYRADQLGVVDVARYIEELCADTFSFKGTDWAEHLTLNLSPVLVSTDRAVTLGLVLTELMINSKKHAYGGDDGPIEIGLLQDRTHLRLIVADKGVGKVATDKGFGSRMVEGLVSQLGGKLTYADNLPGLRTTLLLPVQVVASI
jgi:chemotaxis family two-component system sensor kinase Cph1